MSDIEFLIAVLFAAAVLVRLADLIAIPYPIVLVVAGVAIGFVPGLPAIELAPEAVFLVFLPPLLHASGFNASPQELRAATAQLVSLSFVLVLVTMAAVAVLSHAVIGGLSWPAAFVLGAILAPTDPVSAAAVFSSMGVPERVAVAVETEAMLNDGAALAAYKVAVTAAVAGTFALGSAVAEFVVSVAGGVACGVAIGWAGVRVHRRLADVPLAIFLTVLFAYGAYIGAEELGVLAERLGISWLHPSGVLATVTAGIWFGWHSHEMFDADTRLTGLSFWQVLVFGLNATLFMLLGLQFEGVYASVRTMVAPGALLLDVVVVSLVVIGVRLAWQAVPPLLGRVIPPLRMADTGVDWRERVAVGWSGMRGAISLAAALALPEVLDSGAAFEQRSLLIFVTVGVIAVTLVGQGLTLPLLLRWLGLQGEREWSPDEAIARLEAAQAALDRLDELEREGRISEERLRRMRELYRARFRRCMAVIGGDGEEARAASREPVARYSALRRELIGVERDAILGLRNEGRLRPDVMREIQRDLDLEEARLPA
ncbi:MAG: monovalent cation/hydrogen antiporter [Solirubrobacteraceae bacterium]|nr:monovalent cation/hydrogen antiporter [Solirubrobacteraceae bacterium]